MYVFFLWLLLTAVNTYSVMWKDHFVVSAIQFYPWVQSIVKNENGSVHVDGIGPKILKIISEHLNFTYHYYDTRGLNFGIYFPENGSWTGVGGMLQRKEVDIQFTWIPGIDRQDKIAPTREITFCNTRILGSVGLLETTSFLSFLKTFDNEIWYCMLGLTTASIVVMAISDTLFKFEDLKFKYMTKEIAYFILVFSASLFCEGSFRTPNSGKSRFLLGLWLMAILILMNGFCGQFKAVLMSQKEEPRIRTVKDLAERENLITYIAVETVYETSLRDSTIQDRRQVYKNALKFRNQSMIQIGQLNQLSLYQNIKNGKGVALTDVMASKSYLMHTCENLIGNRRFYFSEEEIHPFRLIYGIRDDVPKEWMKAFNLRIQWLIEAHIVEKLAQDSIWNYEKCENIDEKSEGGLELKDLIPIIHLVLAIDLISLSVLLTEIIYHKKCVKSVKLGL